MVQNLCKKMERYLNHYKSIIVVTKQVIKFLVYEKRKPKTLSKIKQTRVKEFAF